MVSMKHHSSSRHTGLRATFRSTFLPLLLTFLLCCLFLYNMSSTFLYTPSADNTAVTAQNLMCLQRIVATDPNRVSKQDFLIECRDVNVSHILTTLQQLQSFNKDKIKNSKENLQIPKPRAAQLFHQRENSKEHEPIHLGFTDDIIFYKKCRTVRDITSESNEDVNARLESFPDIIGSCGEYKPMLISNQSTQTVSYESSKSSSNASTSSTSSSTSQLPVPNVVHYVWFGESFELTFLNYLSLLSVSRFIRPTHIFIHGDAMPRGEWWERASRDIPNIYHVNRTRPVLINGVKPNHI